MKKLILKFLKVIDSFFYPDFDVKNSSISPYILFRLGFCQKILGFNREVRWPVHWKSVFKSPDKIKPGSRTPGLSPYCYFDGRNGIELGENVWIGPGAKIISMNHNPNNYHEYIKGKPIVIGNNCWIGADAIILPEVKLGDHTVVGAGAVVTKSFPNGNKIIGGSPAKILKELPDYEERN